MPKSTDHLWHLIAQQGFSLGHVSYLSPSGQRWMVDASKEDTRIVKDAESLEKALRMILSEIQERAAPDPDSMPLPSCHSPEGESCAYHWQGSCVAYREDAWETLPTGEVIRCRFRRG